MSCCSNSGCDQPGTHQCGACKTKNYCSPRCQTTDWPNHKVECPGHLRKFKANLEKAKGFDLANNWPQSLHHANIACNQSFFCTFNKEYFDAALYARTLWETITMSRDSHIPDNKRDDFTARRASELARALWQLAAHGDMPAEEQKETGVEAIMLARKALEINTQLYGAESERVACDMMTLASVLDYFNGVDAEVFRLYEHAKSIYIRIYGTCSNNVATSEYNLGMMHKKRAKRAYAAHDLDRCIADLELALPRFREAARIYRAINQLNDASDGEEQLASIQDKLQKVCELKSMG